MADTTAAAAAAAAGDSKAQHVKAPTWAGPEGFVQYEEDVSVWMFMTTLADNKKGGAMRMALSGVAYEAARTVPVATLITAQGHVVLLAALRTAFGGSDAKRGHSAYRKLKKTYRGNSSMEVYLSAMTLAIAECNNNGYTMAAKTSTAIILDQAGLDNSQQASTVATAAMHKVNGIDEVTALTTALRDLWGGDVVLTPSPNAVMMAVTYAEHEAYMALRRTKPPAAAAAGGSDVYRAPKADPASCWHCGKTGHIRRDCRKLSKEKEQAAKAAAEAKITNAATNEAGYVTQEMAHLVLVANGDDGKTLAPKTGDVILDIGATATIAGAAWVAAYVARLTPSERADIRSSEALAVFTFGGGQTQRAHERVILPMMVGGKRCLVQTWIVAGHLPMLLSRKTMSSLGIILDVSARRMTVQALQVVVGLTMSPAGHLTFNALDRSSGSCAATTEPPVEAIRGFNLMAVLTKETPDLARAANKLHTQYGHSSAARLIELLRQQGVTDTEVFAAVTAAVAKCEACKQTAPRPARPLVSVPRALRFNDTVAVDLAEVAPLGRFLHIVDLGTRFAKAVAIPNKTTATVTRALLSGWLAHHGSPRMILSDPGGEFDSDLWRAMAERYNIGVCTTATQAHFSNGVVERHNQTLKTMVSRLHKDHPGACAQELLDLACLAKNSMAQHNGATPFQLMSGSTPRLPSAITDGLPALSGDNTVAGDEALRLHLELLHSAREAHTKAEADASLRRALARNAANVPHREWSVGDVVYYWTEGATPSQGAWHGPAHITDVAVAKNAVRIQHGHGWTNRHVSQVRLAGQPLQPTEQAPATPAASPSNTTNSEATTAPVTEHNKATPSPAASVRPGGTARPSADESSDDGNDTASMFASARAAMDRADAEGLPTTAGAPKPPQGPWSGRTRNRQAHFFSGTPPGASPDLKGYKHDIHMARSVDADWARRLYANRVKRIKRGPATQRESMLTLAKAALDATLAGLAKEDQALYLYEGRREAINMTIKDPETRRARLEKAESAMLACFSGPDELEAARRRTAMTRLLASDDRRKARRRVEAINMVNGMTDTSDTLDAALRRTGAAQHQAFITRREMRRRSEVPIAQAGTAFDPAIAQELEAWAELAVYTEVPYTGQVVISTRWVLTFKQPDTPTGTLRRKARLVVRGFEDPDRDAVDSTSPTASRATLRVVLSALSTHGFIPRTVDVRTAFLQGMPLDRPTAVFVQPPPQARVPRGMVWQLRKCAYGLTDAPRRWYESVLKLMMDLELTRSSLDHGLFTRHVAGRLVLVVAVHVDDFLFGGTAAAVARFESGLRRAFETGPTKSGDMTFTGLRVKTTMDDDTGNLTVFTDQDQYVDSIETIDIRPERMARKEARLTPEELTAYRRATGALLWSTGQTLPYLACATTSLARRFTCAVVHDLTVANKVIATAKAARPMPLVYARLRGQQRLRLFVDASSVKTGVPTAHTGYAIFASPASVPAGVMPADAPLVLLQYGSHRQRRVTHSSFAAEVYAMLEGVRAAKDLAVVHALVNHGNEYTQAPVDVYTDNLSLYNTLDADGVVQPKEVGAAVQELREMYHQGTMATITWLRAHGQLADALTKHGRETPLQHTIRTGTYGVRLANTDYLTKRSAAAPDQEGIMDIQYCHPANHAHTTSDGSDDGDTGDADGTGKGEYE